MRIFFVTLIWLCLSVFPAKASNTQVGSFIFTYGTVNGPHPLSAVRNNVSKEYWTITAPTRDFKEAEKSGIETAANYWAERMAQARPGMSVNFFVGYVDDPRSSAFSLSPLRHGFVDADIAEKISPNDTAFDALRSGKPSPYPSGLADAIFIINDPTYSTNPQRALLNPYSLTSVIMHEMGHPLGVHTSYLITEDKKYGYFAPDRFTEWNAHLHDVFGKQAKPGMHIAMDAEDGPRDSVFQVYSEALNDAGKYVYPTFHGKHVDTLTGGAGMPVMGGFSGAGPGLDGSNALGHPGIMQSVMSYGVFQNMAFTELELAMFQDLGYDIDRSLFFGKSYYLETGGNTQTNTLGFGSAQFPNTSSFGVGLHVMRNNLHLSQLGNIHANGYGAAGMRVDGVSNSLILPAEVSVAANGEKGTGVLVSYGKENILDVKGKITALGTNGVGIWCAFSNTGILDFFSYMSRNNIARSSDIQQEHEALRIEADLDGPLVRRIDLDGTLLASDYALYIGIGAHVAEINVRDGAVIAGDIYSSWARNLIEMTSGGADTNDYATALTFGTKGRGGVMRLNGDIIWGKGISVNDLHFVNSLDITQAGGLLHFNGKANVHQWNIHAGATLSGNNVITLEGGTPLVNAGSIAPGNSIGSMAVNGDYTQTASGTLNMEFNASRADSFTVKGMSSLDGTLILSPLPDFYASGEDRLLSDAELFGGTLAQSAFNTVSLGAFHSPTLHVALRGGSSGGTVFSVQRDADAYSRYAFGKSSAGVGKALDSIVSHARDDMRNLFTALDYSSPDGAEVRSGLRQLSPSVYNSTARASLDENQAFAAMLHQNLLTAHVPAERAKGTKAGGTLTDSAPWQLFLLPYGGWSFQDARQDKAGYNTSNVGLVAGVNRQSDAGLAGLHVAFSHRELLSHASTKAQSRAESLRVGAHALFWPVEGLYLSGLANVGLENTQVWRDVRINDYARSNRADFLALTGLASLRAGYEWQLRNLRFGPVVGLEYSAYHLPSVAEYGGQATKLRLVPETWHDLRSQIGLQARADFQPRDDMHLSTSLAALWSHQLLASYTGAKAAFADYQGADFSTAEKRKERDALALQGSVSLHMRDNLSLSAFAGAEVLREGYTAGRVALSIEWTF